MGYRIQQEPDIVSTWIFAILLILIVIAAVIIFCGKFLVPFRAKTRYIKMEIKRSNGDEHRYWKKKLKKHYLCSIPFVGRFLLKFIK